MFAVGSACEQVGHHPREVKIEPGYAHFKSAHAVADTLWPENRPKGISNRVLML
jgi:hypothetical protein